MSKIGVDDSGSQCIFDHHRGSQIPRQDVRPYSPNVIPNMVKMSTYQHNLIQVCANNFKKDNLIEQRYIMGILVIMLVQNSQESSGKTFLKSTTSK